ncbi:MAG: four helix bundle protein [Planctomycetota bacterium]
MSEKNATINSFKDLHIWQRSIKLIEKIYRFTSDFPQQERFGLTSQIRRASVSIPSNIAEGFARAHKTEYKQFLHHSLGSCAELTTQLIIASKLNYINKNDSEELLKEIEEISKMTMSLIKKLKIPSKTTPND